MTSSDFNRFSKYNNTVEFIFNLVLSSLQFVELNCGDWMEGLD